MNAPSSASPLIVLAAGGTGGHVFPAEALARELLGRGFRVALVTDRRAARFSAELPIPVHCVRSSALGRSLFGRLKGLVTMGVGVIEASLLLHKLKPAAVVGFGGYPSIPPLYAALRAGLPILLHEQNAVLGRANKALMGRAKILATSFPQVRGAKAGTGTVILQTGNPVRPAFAALRATPYTPLGTDGPVRLLVLGGSLGASIFSRVVPAALALLPEALRERLIVAQQCRAEDLETAKAAYAGAGVEASFAPFFADVPERMAGAHLIICRAGGSTIAELTAIGRPAIMVPFAGSIAGEQSANAEALADAGGGWVFPEAAFTPEALSVRLESLLNLPDMLTKTAAASRAWGTISAADNLADCVEEALGLHASKGRGLWRSNPDVSGEQSALAVSTSERFS